MNVLLTTAAALALKASVGIGIVFVLWRLSGRAPAQLRHALLASALVSALLMPLLALLTPVIAVPFLPAVLLSVMAQPAVTPDAVIPVLVPHDGVSAPILVFLAYLAVVVVLLLRQGVALARLRALELGPAGPSLRARLRLHRHFFPRTRPVRLLEGSGIGTPMTWGFVRPVLVLPEGARHWSDQLIDEALIHELAHIRRGDWLVQRLADLCCAVYWFLPPVWYMAGHLRMEAEHACDDVVLNRFGSRADYAAHLVELARSQRSNSLFPAVAMATVSPLSRRINAILDSRQRRNTMRPRAICAVFSLPLGLFVALAAIQATASEAPVPPVDESSVSAPATPGPSFRSAPEPALGPVPAATPAPAAPVPAMAPEADKEAAAPAPVTAQVPEAEAMPTVAPVSATVPAPAVTSEPGLAPVPSPAAPKNAGKVPPATVAPEIALWELREVQREAERAEDVRGREVRDVQREAERAERVRAREVRDVRLEVKRAAREMEHAARDVQREAERAERVRAREVRDVRLEAKRAAREMEHAARDVQREAKRAEDVRGREMRDVQREAERAERVRAREVDDVQRETGRAARDMERAEHDEPQEA